MGKRIWPPGIYPSGKGLRIKIFKGSKCIYSETIEGDAHSKAFIRSVAKRRDYLESRKRLGLPFSGEETDSNAAIFAEAAQEYLHLLGDRKASVRQEYLNGLNYYWMPVFKNMLCHEITEAQIKTVLASHAIGWKTKRNALTPLRGVLDHAKVNPNPAKAVQPKKGQKKPINRYTPDEREKLLTKLSGDAKVYFSVLFGCGLRPSEAMALTWDRWDGEYLLIDRGVVRGRIDDSTKTHKARKVYVPTWVRPLLNSMASRFAGGFVFVNQRGGHFTAPETYNKRWAEAHKKARIPYRNPYTCRHTRAAEMLSGGSSRYAEMAAQMGHSLEMFLNIYSELIDEYSSKDNSIFEGFVSKDLTTDKKLTK